jgi:endonuclease YncB( thermonuclease family)
VSRAIKVAVVFCALWSGRSLAAGAVDKDYIRSLAAPGKTVLVIEYYDGQGKVADRKGYASASGFVAISPTDIRVSETVTVRLYGIEPCDGDMVNQREQFSGSCTEFARRGLQTLLKSPKVVFCRAFVSEARAPTQDATCYGYYNYPGSLDTVDMFEEQLVSLGTHRIATKPDGTLERPDLRAAGATGRGGFGMWADPRIKNQ